MVGEQGRVDLSALRTALERAVEAADSATLPAIVGVCAEMGARATARLATPVPLAVPAPPSAALVDAGEMARRIDMSVYWLRDQARANNIPVHRVGRRLLFDPSAVVAAVKALELKTSRKDGGRDRRSWVPRTRKRPENGGLVTAGQGAQAVSAQKSAQRGESEAAR